jgi:hypothetical protein
VDTWDAITARRNVREFDDRPISREHLDRILEAARPLTPLKRPNRRPFAEVVHYDHW